MPFFRCYAAPFVLVSPSPAWAAAPQLYPSAAAAAEDEEDEEEDALNESTVNGPLLDGCAMNALASHRPASGMIIIMDILYFLWILPAVWAVEGKPVFNS